MLQKWFFGCESDKPVDGAKLLPEPTFLDKTSEKIPLHMSQSVTNISKNNILCRRVFSVLRKPTLPWSPFLKKPHNFSRLFRAPQFPLYLLNADILSHQTLEPSWLFLHQKYVKRSAFQNKRIAVSLLAFRAQKFLGTFQKQVPW